MGLCRVLPTFATIIPDQVTRRGAWTKTGTEDERRKINDWKLDFISTQNTRLMYEKLTKIKTKDIFSIICLFFVYFSFC